MNHQHEIQGGPNSGTLTQADTSQTTKKATGSFGPPYYPITRTPLGTLFASIERFLTKIETSHKIKLPIPENLSHAEVTLWRVVLGIKDLYQLLKSTIERFDEGADPGVTGFAGILLDLKSLVEGLLSGKPRPSARLLNIPPPILAIQTMLDFELEDLKKELEEKAKSKSFVVSEGIVLPLVLAKLKKVKDRVDTNYFPAPLLKEICSKFETTLRQIINEHFHPEPLSAEKALADFEYSFYGTNISYNVRSAAVKALGSVKPEGRTVADPAFKTDLLAALEVQQTALLEAASKQSYWGPSKDEIYSGFASVNELFGKKLDALAHPKPLADSAFFEKLKRPFKKDEFDIASIPLDITLLYQTWEFALNAVIQLHQDCQDPFSLLKFFNPEALAHSLLGLIAIKVTNAKKGEYTVTYIGKEEVKPGEGEGEKSKPRDPAAFSLSELLENELNPVLVSAINGLYKVGLEVLQGTGLLEYIKNEKQWLDDFEKMLTDLTLTLPETTANPVTGRAVLEELLISIPQLRETLAAKIADSQERQHNYETFTAAQLVELLKVKLKEEEEKKKAASEGKITDLGSAANGLHTNGFSSSHDSAGPRLDIDLEKFNQLSLTGLDLYLPEWIPEEIEEKPAQKTANQSTDEQSNDESTYNHHKKEQKEEKINYHKKPLRSALIQQAKHLATEGQKKLKALELFESQIKQQLEHVEDLAKLQTFDKEHFQPSRELCQQTEVQLKLQEKELDIDFAHLDDTAADSKVIALERSLELLRQLQQGIATVRPAIADKPQQIQAQFKFPDGLAAVKLKQTVTSLTTQASELGERCQRLFEQTTSRIQQLHRHKKQLQEQTRLGKLLQDTNLAAMPAKLEQLREDATRNTEELGAIAKQIATDSEQQQRLATLAQQEGTQLEQVRSTMARVRTEISSLDTSIRSDAGKLAAAQQAGVVTKPGQKKLEGKPRDFNNLMESLDPALIPGDDLPLALARELENVDRQIKILRACDEKLNGKEATKELFSSLDNIDEILEILFGKGTKAYNDALDQVNRCRNTLTWLSTQSGRTALQISLQEKIKAAIGEEKITDARETSQAAGFLQQRKATLRKLIDLQAELIGHRMAIATLDGSEGAIAKNRTALDKKQKEELPPLLEQERLLDSQLKGSQLELAKTAEALKDLEEQKAQRERVQVQLDQEISKLKPQVAMYQLIEKVTAQVELWHATIDDFSQSEIASVFIPHDMLNEIYSKFAALDPSHLQGTSELFSALIKDKDSELANLAKKSAARDKLAALKKQVASANDLLNQLAQLVPSKFMNAPSEIETFATGIDTAHAGLDQTVHSLTSEIGELDKNESLLKQLETLRQQVVAQKKRKTDLLAEAEFRRKYATHNDQWLSLLGRIQSHDDAIQQRKTALIERQTFTIADVKSIETAIASLQERMAEFQKEMGDLDLAKKTVLSEQPAQLASAIAELADIECKKKFAAANDAINEMRTQLDQLQQHNEQRGKFVADQKQQLDAYLVDRANRFAKKDTIFSGDKTQRENFVEELKAVLDTFSREDNIGVLIQKIDEGIKRFPGQVFAQNYLIPMRRRALHPGSKLVIGSKQQFAVEPMPPETYVLWHWILRHKLEIGMALLLTTAAVLMFTLPVLGQLIGTSIVLFKAAALLQLMIPSLTAAMSMLITQIALPALIGLAVFATTLTLGCLVRMGLTAACSSSEKPSETPGGDAVKKDVDLESGNNAAAVLQPPPALSSAPA